ncbi:MAG TPA: rod shape-determining protein MreD [Chloroflexota bacterium]
MRPRRSPARHFVVAGVALLVAAITQTTAAAYLPPTWARPDLVLMVALAWVYLRGGGEGFLAGVVGGLLLDFSSSVPFGLHILAYGLALWLVGSENGPFVASMPRRLAGAVVAAALVHGLILVVMQLRGWDVAWWNAVFRSLLPALALDAVVLLVCYGLLRRLPAPAPDALVLGS